MDTGSAVGLVVVITFLVTLLFVYQRSADKLKMRVAKLEDDLKRCRKEKDNAWSLLAKEGKKALDDPQLIISNHISMSVESFSTSSFFSKGPVKLFFGGYFKSWILPAIPETIPAFSISLSSFSFTKNMYDKEILTELGNPEPFTISEFAALIKNLISRQPVGEAGDLLNNGYLNIFYMKLDDERVVAVSVRWDPFDRWCCGADDLDFDDWSGGSKVFVRSSDVSVRAS